MLKRNLLAVLISVIALVAIVAIATVPVLFSRADSHAAPRVDADDQRATTINGLKLITEVGSTQFVLDAKGATQDVDPNPYKIAFVPKVVGANNQGIKAGDILVTNIGAEDKGVTLINFPQKKGPGHIFNAANPATVGPAGQAFNTQTGTNWVANFVGNNVQIFRPNGTVVTTLTSPMFNMPWGMAYNNGLVNPAAQSTGSFFTSNAGTATIDRIDIVTGNNGPTFKIVPIAQLTKGAEKTKIDLQWVPTINVQNTQLKDVLLALDPVNNRIVAFPNSTTMPMLAAGAAVTQGTTVFQGKPLNMPGGMAVNPINGDLLVVNEMDNNLVEINPVQGKLVGIKQVDNVPVDANTGNGSALFGVAATTDEQGNLIVYFTDDNTNTLDKLSRN